MAGSNGESLLPKLNEAGIDGIMTGIDIIGTILGHITKRTEFTGYVYDQYSGSSYTIIVHRDGDSDPPNIDYIPPSGFEPPLKRSVPEQIVKGVGTTIGLAINIATLGLPELFCLYTACNKIKETREEYIDL